MAGFTLQTSTRERIGFLLLAGSESLATGDCVRDCVLLSAPANSALIDHELNVFLSENRATEFRCHLIRQDDSWLATVNISADCRVHLRCSGYDAGEWRIEHFARVYNGICEITGKRA